MNRIQNIIEACLEYIETHLREKITLDHLAANIGISKYHLHRIFKSLTGETLIGYTNSRKLAESIHELLHTRMKILDIALEYGFEHEQSYIRAFKKEYGRTPFKARTGGAIIPIRERINSRDFAAVDEAITFKPFFVFKPAFRLVGMKHVIPVDADYLTANRVGRDFFYHHKLQIKNPVNPEIYFGYVDWSTLPLGHVTYFPSVQVSRFQEIAAPLEALTIPAYKYAVFRFIGFFSPDQVNVSHFHHLLQFMYSKWIFEADYDVAAQFRIECIDSGLAKDDYCEVDIYQPIENKAEVRPETPFHYSVYQKSHS